MLPFPAGGAATAQGSAPCVLKRWGPSRLLPSEQAKPRCPDTFNHCPLTFSMSLSYWAFSSSAFFWYLSTAHEQQTGGERGPAPEQETCAADAKGASRGLHLHQLQGLLSSVDPPCCRVVLGPPSLLRHTLPPHRTAVGTACRRSVGCSTAGSWPPGHGLHSLGLLLLLNVLPQVSDVLGNLRCLQLGVVSLDLRAHVTREQEEGALGPASTHDTMRRTHT